MDFNKKVKGNIWGQIPLSKHKGLRGVSNSTKRRHHFKIPITAPSSESPKKSDEELSKEAQNGKVQKGKT